MAKATPEEVKRLEFEHKTLFVDLVTANHIWIFGMLPKIKGLKPGDKRYDAVVKFARDLAQKVGRWYAFQKQLEVKAKIPAVDKNIVAYFLSPPKENLLVEQAKKYIYTGVKGTNSVCGIGIIPLIVWGVIAIIGAFTAYEIIDETTTSADEKKELLKQTETTLKELNITGPEAAAIINSTQKQASEGGQGIFSSLSNLTTPLFILAGAFLLLKNNNQKTTANV